MLVTPFSWEKGPEAVVVDSIQVVFLQVVPISDLEYEYWKVSGGDSLEKKFLGAQIDIFDANRPSVI